MTRVYVCEPGEWPPSPALVEQIDADEFVLGIPPRLAALGITAMGFHEIQEPGSDNAPILPEVVSRRQAKRALLDAGLLHLVDPAIAAMPSPPRERAKIDWDEALEFRRDSPLVAFLGAALGLDAQQIDALFIAAAAIE